MYHPVRKKPTLYSSVILLLATLDLTQLKSIDISAKGTDNGLLENSVDNNIIDFDEDYSIKLNKKYNTPWHGNTFNKENKRYTIIKKDENNKDVRNNLNNTQLKLKVQKDLIKSDKINNTDIKRKLHVLNLTEESTTQDYSVIPLELVSTTENKLISIFESTTELDLTVIPLSTTNRIPKIDINDTATLPSSTDNYESTTNYPITDQNDSFELKLTVIPLNLKDKDSGSNETVKLNLKTSTDMLDKANAEIDILVKTTNIKEEDSNSDQTTIKTNIKTTTDAVVTDGFEIETTVEPLNVKEEEKEVNSNKTIKLNLESTTDVIVTDNIEFTTSMEVFEESTLIETTSRIEAANYSTKPITLKLNSDVKLQNKTENTIILNNNKKLNSTVGNKNISRSDTSKESDEEVPIFTELDAEEEKDVPEDYYDSKDVVPTTAPRTDALSVIFGLAGTVVESVVESVAERVVPKSIFDLFKRMQRQNEALEAERLRSPEENGGLGQFTRGIIKSISSGISKPFSQLMAGARDIGSLDTDRGFVSSIASGVTSVANVAYSVADAFKDRVQAIYPGTVWCGDGRSATARSSDLGLFFFTDTCCRQHDACKLYIRAGQTKYGLTNTGLFTRSHCSCDVKFRECLHKTNSLVSSQIGLTYFNVLGPQCFRRAHPIVKCIRRTRITGLKCEEYELDYTKPRMWQWFDNETF